MKKLEPEHQHIMNLIQRDREDSGWVTVSETLYPVLSENMPDELVEFELTDNGGRARLTQEGENVLNAMQWL